MNYIQQFMRNKKLVPGQPFRVSNARNLWFCFTEDYRLDLYEDDEYMRTCLNFESILLQLLSGEISVSPIKNRKPYEEVEIVCPVCGCKMLYG